MATVNKALKKRAKDFAAEHGLPYLKALHAVDEPLHELRDLIQSVREWESTREHFRLVGDQGPLSSAYPIPQTESWERKIEIHGERVTSGIYRREIIQSDDLSTLSDLEFFIELGRRTVLLESSGSDSIWGYRELYRAGLLDNSCPQLEPLFHHYTMNLSYSFGPLIWSGARFGIFGVNMDAFVEITVHDHIPVTSEQLNALRVGEKLDSPVELPLNHLPTEDNRRLKWTDSYVGAYRYFDAHGAGSVGPGLYLLLRSPIVDISAELANRGVDFSRFVEIEDFPLGVELRHSLLKDSLMISLPERNQRITTPGLLVLG